MINLNCVDISGMCDGGLEDGCLAASRDDTTINALDVVCYFQLIVICDNNNKLFFKLVT